MGFLISHPPSPSLGPFLKQCFHSGGPRLYPAEPRLPGHLPWWAASQSVMMISLRKYISKQSDCQFHRSLLFSLSTIATTGAWSCSSSSSYSKSSASFESTRENASSTSSLFSLQPLPLSHVLASGLVCEQTSPTELTHQLTLSLHNRACRSLSRPTA